VATVGSVGALAAAACCRRIWATDLWWQYATGRLVAAGGWPTVDPFTYTAAGAPWIEMRWLYCLALYELMRSLGPAAVVVVKTLAVGMAFALVTLPRVRRAGAVAAGAVVLVGLLAASDRLLVRPELVTWVLFGAFLFVLDRQRTRGGRGIWLLPALQLVWVNTHASFALGPLLVGLGLGVALAAAWLGRDVAARSSLRPLALVFALVLAACFVNPYGAEGLLVPFRQFAQIRHSVFKEVISEYQSPFAPGPLHVAVAAFWLLIGMCLASAAANLRRLDPFWSLLCAGQLYLATIAVRNLPLFALAALPFILSNLERAPVLQRLRPTVAGAGRRALALATIALSLWFVRDLATDRFSVRQNDSKQFGLGIADHRYPVAAVDFLDRAGLDGRIFATLLESSYLIARGRPVFADPRGDFHDDARFARYLDAQRDPAAWRVAVREYDIRIALTSLASPLVKLLERDDEWRLVFFDTVAAVYVRADSLAGLTPLESEPDYDRALEQLRRSLPPARAWRDAGWLERVTSPRPYLALADFAIASGHLGAAEPLLEEAAAASPFLRGIPQRRAALAQARGDWPRLLEQAGAALREAPRDPQASFALGEALFHLGRHEEAAAALRRATTLRPDHAASWHLLGSIAMLRGDHAGAVADLGRAVELAPAVGPYRHNLARALAVTGQSGEAVRQLERALESSPRDATVLRDLAILHLGAGDTQRARQSLERALAIAPDDPDLARLREAIGP